MNLPIFFTTDSPQCLEIRILTLFIRFLFPFLNWYWLGNFLALVPISKGPQSNFPPFSFQCLNEKNMKLKAQNHVAIYLASLIWVIPSFWQEVCNLHVLPKIDLNLKWNRAHSHWFMPGELNSYHFTFQIQLNLGGRN